MQREEHGIPPLKRYFIMFVRGHTVLFLCLLDLVNNNATRLLLKTAFLRWEVYEWLVGGMFIYLYDVVNNIDIKVQHMRGLVNEEIKYW